MKMIVSMKNALMVGASLATLSMLSVAPVHAGTITETEPNNTDATANGLIGNSNDLIALGQISTISDIDTFRFQVTSPGDVQIDGFGSSSGGGLTLDNVALFGLNNQQPHNQLIGFDFGAGVRDGHLTLNDLPTGTYYAAIGSGDDPNGTYTGTYRLEVQGVNGGIVAGSPSPVPEASTIVSLSLMFALGGAAVATRKRRTVIKAQ